MMQSVFTFAKVRVNLKTVFRCRTRLPQALIGRFARDGFVNADEIRNAIVSATRGDLADRCTAAAEHFFGLIDARAVEVLLKGHSRYATKATRKITVAHAKTACQLSLIHILGIVVAHVNHCVVNECGGLGVRCFFLGGGVAAQNFDQKLHNFEFNCHL